MTPAKTAGAQVADSPKPDDDFGDEYRRFVGGTQLRSVEQLSLTAERLGQGPAATFDLSLTPELAILDDHVYYRFDASVDLRSSEGETVCSVSAAVALDFTYEGERPTEEIAAQFGSSTGMLVAHPYVREAIQSLAARIGFPQVVLPLVPIPTGPPVSSAGTSPTK